MRGDAFTPVPNRGMITISIMLANIMQGLDNTILNVALPHIQGSLSASLDQIAWTLTSYIVCSAIMMPLTGWLAGRFGIKYIFLVSIIGFTIASALCGAATSLGELVAVHDHFLRGKTLAQVLVSLRYRRFGRGHSRSCCLCAFAQTGNVRR